MIGQAKHRRCKKKAQQPGLLPGKPPKFAVNDIVVIKHFEDGWQWKIVDATLAVPRAGHTNHRQTKACWFYQLETIRPYDDKLVTWARYEFSLRHIPAKEAHLSHGRQTD
jgi:hypothetical protein